MLEFKADNVIYAIDSINGHHVSYTDHRFYYFIISSLINQFYEFET